MGHSFQQVENHTAPEILFRFLVPQLCLFFFKIFTTFYKSLHQYTIFLLCFESINTSHFPCFIIHTWPPWGLPLLLLSAVIAVTLSDSN